MGSKIIAFLGLLLVVAVPVSSAMASKASKDVAVEETTNNAVHAADEAVVNDSKYWGAYGGHPIGGYGGYPGGGEHRRGGYGGGYPGSHGGYGRGYTPHGGYGSGHPGRGGYGGGHP